MHRSQLHFSQLKVESIVSADGIFTIPLLLDTWVSSTAQLWRRVLQYALITQRFHPVKGVLNMLSGSKYHFGYRVREPWGSLGWRIPLRSGPDAVRCSGEGFLLFV